MKNKIITLVLCFFCSQGFSQVSSGYEYRGRSTASIKKEKLNEARFISDIMPEFSKHFALPAKEYNKFRQLLKIENSPQGNYMYPNEYFHQQENYEKVIDYVSIEIIAVCNGKTISEQSKKSTLTIEQKSILTSADLGTDINVKIKFKYKYPTAEFPEVDNKEHEGKYTVAVVPEIEAEYPGGFKQITNYIKENVIYKIPKIMFSEKIQNAIVKFTINEEGKIVDTKIARTTTDPKMDKLFIDAINKMPKWKPAQNEKGIKVKQEFSIPLGNSGC